MRTRCTKENSKAWEHYGARGIRFCFSSVLSGALWIQSELGLHREKELDRIDNNGDYAPGNLRYVTRSQNAMNQRRSKMTEATKNWAETKSPFSISTTNKYFRKGFPPEAIVGLAYKAVMDKRKNWGAIKAKLKRLGYSI
jgi:hypothetical protein